MISTIYADVGWVGQKKYKNVLCDVIQGWSLINRSTNKAVIECDLCEKKGKMQP